MLLRMGQTVIKASGIDDLIQIVPHLVGFEPQDSVVLSCLDARGRTGLTVRIDLPDPRSLPHLVQELTTIAVEQGADGALVLCYPPGAPDPDPSVPLPGLDLVLALRTSLQCEGIRVAKEFLVHGGRRWSYEPGHSRAGVPLPSRPGSAVTHFAAERALVGRRVLESRGALEASVQPVPEEAADMDTGARRLMQVLGTGGRRGAMDTVLALVRSAARSYGETSLDPVDRGLVLLAVHDLHVRDALMTLGLEVEGRDRAGDLDSGALLDVLTRLARAATDDCAAAICGVLAGVAYACGNGALTNVALDRALACDPDHVFAGLLKSMLAFRLPPENVHQILEGVRSDLALGGAAPGAGEPPELPELPWSA